MAVRLRLKRMGRRHRPYYRMAAVDARAKRDGRVIEEIGLYDPLAKSPEAELTVEKERAAYWLSVGAQPSDTVRALLQRSGVVIPEKIATRVKTKAAPAQ